MSPSKTDVAQASIENIEAASEEIFKAAEKLLSSRAAAHLSDQAIQRLLTAGTRLFAHKVEMERRNFSPFTSADATTATEAVEVMSGMLDAVNLSVFDLSMWVDGRGRL